MIDTSADTAAIYGDFARCVTFTLASGSEVRADAIFTEPAEVVDVNSGQAMAVAPTLMVPTCDIESVIKGTTVTLKDDADDTRTFTVEWVQKAGTGDSIVYLKT